MAAATDSSEHTTRARSIETVDGYVSRRRAPPPSVPRDHAMLQDFAVYLELRLKSQNVSMLRRIFADFLNEHENTLVPMMRQGCTIVTIFPVLRTSAQRRQEAESLLAKPKWTLDSRGCVFLYLQYRTATRNMALLKHMFLEFVCQRETALMDFVQRGCQVISVIPFELPQLVPPVSQVPPPVQQVVSDVAVVQKVAKVKKRRKGGTSVQRASPRAASPAVEDVQAPQKKKKRRLRRISETGGETAAVADDSTQRQDTVALTEPEGGVASAQVDEVPVSQKKKARGRPRHAVNIGETRAAIADDSMEQQDVPAPDNAASVQVGELQMAQKKTRGRPRHAVNIGETRAAIADDSMEQQDVPAPDNAASVQVGELQMAQNMRIESFCWALKIRETSTDNSAPQQDAVGPSEGERPAASVQVAEVPVAQTKVQGRPRPAAKTGETLAAIADEIALRQDGIAPRECEGDSAPVQQKNAAVIEGPEEEDAVIDGLGNHSALARQESGAATGEPEIVTKRRRKPSDVPVSAPGGNKEAKTEVALRSSSAAAPTRKRGRKPKARAASDEAKNTGTATTAKPAEAALADSLEPPKVKRGRKRTVDSTVPITEKPRKRGKPVMSDAMCRSQLELTRKMEPFETQIPWEAVYSNLPAPFDEPKHPELSRKYRKFWRTHARAVWERNFWAPMSRKTSLLTFNKRNNRQLTAKNAFETIIISAYKELGAEFFVMLDTDKPRHPGWWYRGPVVALFALQQIKGENAVWDYVKNEALERFPDCKLALPLKAPNSGAVSKCHKRDSDSMWMANHQLTSEMLLAIAALKAGQQTCEKAEATEGDLMTVMDSLALL